MASGPPGSNQLGYVPYGGGAPGAGAAAGLGVTTPITNPKDCVPGFCTANCPQWCYFFPPPPPFDFPDDGGDSSSGPTFSPLVIAIIGILGSAFLLIAYYTIISKYCARLESLRHGGRRRRRHDHTTPLTDDGDGVDGAHHMRHLQGPDGWQNAALVSEGLDEAVIKSITVCKYKKGDGFVEGTDCPVCLTEFHEDESLRLLPKCGHAFHVSCIDTWLKSHSNCPLCRANIAPIPLPMSPPAPVRLPQPAPPQNHQQQGQTHQPPPDPLSRASSNRVNYSVSMEDLLLDRGGSGRREQSVPVPGTAAAAASVKDNSYTASTTIRGFQRGPGSETRGGVDAAAMYEFRDDGAHAHPSRRRDHHISIGQVMETEDGGRGAADAASASSGRRVFVQHSKYGPSKVLHCVMNGFGGGNNNNRHNDNTGSYTHPV